MFRGFTWKTWVAVILSGIVSECAHAAVRKLERVMLEREVVERKASG